MFVPVWALVLAAFLAVVFVMWALAVARGRNPLPFPDGGSRIFAAASPEGKDTVVALLDRHGKTARFVMDGGGVSRTILWDGTIINHTVPEVHEKLGFAAASIGLVAGRPVKAANEAADFLRSRGFEAEVVQDVEVGLPITFVRTNAMVGTVINFRKSILHMPKPQKA
ncbi:hypothetical protein [Brevundimonas sp.]|uniref:hypothetical protein n=1 Tax=Brevundimonas sp. TaxID=1871086 RepID=UPI003D0FA083